MGRDAAAQGAIAARPRQFAQLARQAGDAGGISACKSLVERHLG
jgi:hypothetical protein